MDACPRTARAFCWHRDRAEGSTFCCSAFGHRLCPPRPAFWSVSASFACTVGSGSRRRSLRSRGTSGCGFRPRRQPRGGQRCQALPGRDQPSGKTGTFGISVGPGAESGGPIFARFASVCGRTTAPTVYRACRGARRPRHASKRTSRHPGGTGFGPTRGPSWRAGTARRNQPETARNGRSRGRYRTPRRAWGIPRAGGRLGMRSTGAKAWSGDRGLR